MRKTSLLALSAIASLFLFVSGCQTTHSASKKSCGCHVEADAEKKDCGCHGAGDHESCSEHASGASGAAK